MCYLSNLLLLPNCIFVRSKSIDRVHEFTHLTDVINLNLKPSLPTYFLMSILVSQLLQSLFYINFSKRKKNSSAFVHTKDTSFVQSVFLVLDKDLNYLKLLCFQKFISLYPSLNFWCATLSTCKI